MPRRCTICHHSRHDEIAVSLFRDGTRTTARQFQVSRSALDRHKRHLPDRIVKAQQTEVVCEATLKVKSHPAVSCAIYTRHCPDVCEAAWKSHQEQRDACKAFVASHRQHGWRALPIRYIDSDSSLSTMQRSSAPTARACPERHDPRSRGLPARASECQSPRAGQDHRAAVPAQGIVSFFEPAVKYE